MAHPNVELATRELQAVNSGDLDALLHAKDGKFSEVWAHVADQYALDEFLSG